MRALQACSAVVCFGFAVACHVQVEPSAGVSQPPPALAPEAEPSASPVEACDVASRDPLLLRNYVELQTVGPIVHDFSYWFERGGKTYLTRARLERVGEGWSADLGLSFAEPDPAPTARSVDEILGREAAAELRRRLEAQDPSISVRAVSVHRSGRDVRARQIMWLPGGYVDYGEVNVVADPTLSRTAPGGLSEARMQNLAVDHLELEAPYWMAVPPERSEGRLLGSEEGSLRDALVEDMLSAARGWVEGEGGAKLAELNCLTSRGALPAELDQQLSLLLRIRRRRHEVAIPARELFERGHARTTYAFEDRGQHFEATATFSVTQPESLTTDGPTAVAVVVRLDLRDSDGNRSQLSATAHGDGIIEAGRIGVGHLLVPRTETYVDDNSEAWLGTGPIEWGGKVATRVEVGDRLALGVIRGDER